MPLLIGGFSILGGIQGTPIFPQYLKDARVGKNPKYNLTQINNYPSFTFAVAVIAAVIYAWISDSVLGGRRWPMMLFGGVCSR
jgi:ACS family pantothenate transporter-like MFS transporter